MQKQMFCVIVPAYNEEKVIEGSLDALKKVISKEDIFVVSDGSTDNTVPLAYSKSVNVLALQENFGKAEAIHHLIQSFNLTIYYQYILFADADSHLSDDFIKIITPITKNQPACIVGTVLSEKKGLISAFRTYEYGLTHLVFKNAQNAMQTITVAPGCASLYRCDVLEKLDFSRGTLTEDFDLTLQIHQKKLGRIVYASKAKVITQDPLTVKDYWKQVLRWYTGFWQNIFLHKLYLPNKKINLEVLLLTLDAFAGLATIVYILLHPDLLIKMLAVMFMSMIIVSNIILIFQKQFWAIAYSPFFPLLYFVNLIAYISGFVRSISKRKALAWHKVARY